MKKYIIFFISIGLLLGTVLVYNTMNAQESKKVTFNESGYIINSGADRVYFYQDETYTTSYNDKIVFYDTEGSKVTLGNDNFIHYSSGNIVALQESVLLELSKIDDDPIIYYNISANKEVKKTSNRYTIKNLDTDLQFDQAIWKISSNKYIILAEKIKLKLDNGTEKELKEYVEIEYSDNEIVNIYNQEFSYQTISSDSYIELPDDIKINLGTKIVSKEEENKMSLEEMVINSDDNVTIVDLNTDSEKKEENEENEENSVEENNVEGSVIQGGTTSSSTTNSNSNSQSTIVNQGGTTNTGTEQNDNKIEIDTPEIKFDDLDDTETEVDLSTVVDEPKFKLENMKVTALGLKGNIKITDDNDLLSKEEDVIVKIINNKTGKIVYTSNEQYGTLNIPIDIQTLMPDTQYTIISTATYSVGENLYTKNFLYKTFVTSKIGIDIVEDGFTDDTLNFDITFSDKLIKSVEISILDENGVEIPNRKQKINNVNNETEKIYFDGLNSNTKYRIKLSNIQYNGATQQGENWTVYYDDCKTLKSKISIDGLNYSIDKRNGKFTLFIEEVTDTDGAIQNYTYIMYKYVKTIDSEGKETLSYDTQDVVYRRETTNKEITVDVGIEENGDAIVRDTYYGFKVIANSFDNEKYVEVESTICGPFVLSGKTFPTVKFNKKEITAISIEGTIYISDPDNTIIIDEENPLSLIYKNQVGDEEEFIKIEDPDTVSIENDENGEKVIAIPVKLEKLKAETSYVFSAYGSVDLEDGNTYGNIFIGSAIVTTGSYKELKANFLSKAEENNTFTVDFNLEGEEFEKENLESITFIMQEGSDFKPTDRYWSLEINNTNCSAYAKEGMEITTLKELLCDDIITLTPSMIGGGKESDYTELNYVLLATITVDGTKYANKIPVYSVENAEQKIGNTTFTDEENEKYTAAYIIVDGKGTVAEIPDVTEETVTVNAIYNNEAEKHGLNDEKLNDDTIVGYEVKAAFVNNGSRSANSITYYVWDKAGNPVLGEDGKQITYTEEFKNNRNTPSAVFELDYGTTLSVEEDNKSGMHRGCAYYFSYTVQYVDDNGNIEIWPNCVDSTMNEKSLRSNIVYPYKQQPSFVMYPKTSDNSSITYIYSCYDYDKALEYDADNLSSLEMYINNAIHVINQIDTDISNNETTFKDLKANNTYTIRFKRLLNKVENSTYIAEDLVTQKFEGIVDLQSITYTASYDNEKAPNKIIIELNGNMEYIKRIAGANVTLECEGNTETTKNILKIKYNENKNKYYIEVDVLSFDMSANMVGKDVNVKVSLYYDNGAIGFIPSLNSEYVAYMNTTDEEYKYLTMNQEGTLINETKNTINGNIYKHIFDTQTSNEYAYLTLTNLSGNITKQYELKYTDKGLMYGDKIIVQKEIATQEVDVSNEHKVLINSIVVGIDVKNIETSITSAKINAELINPLNIDIEKIYVEVFGSDDKDASADWTNCETVEIDASNIGEFTLEKLVPSTYYKIRFKYKTGNNSNYIYMYDAQELIIKKEYEFETLATIGIRDIEFKYEAIKYIEKYLDISYKIDQDKSDKYQKTRYEFYEYNSTTQKYTKINLKSENIVINGDSGNTYRVSDGNLYVENAIYNNEDGKSFSEVNEKININPENNIFTFGKQYKLVITPIIEYQTEEIEIENAEKISILGKLDTPSIGIKMLRDDETDEKNIRANITINDNDSVISGSEYGEYTLKVYKYINEKDKSIVNIYDQITGEDITNKTFNVQQHGTNYSIYIPDVDFSYNYELEMTLMLDKENKNSSTEYKETRTVKAIDNEAGIIIGSASAAKNENKIDIEFLNSYKLTDINYIEYTLYNNNNNVQQVGYFEPTAADWIQDTEQGIFRITLPTELQDYGTYIITLNFYKIKDGNKMFAGNKEMNYTYASE